MRKTFVLIPNENGRANTAKIVGCLGDDGTFYEAKDRFLLGNPIGEIGRDDCVKGGWPRKEIGGLSVEGDVRRGLQYTGDVVARVVGNTLELLDDTVVLEADGPEPGRALAAAWILLPGLEKGTERRAGAVLAGATLAAGVAVAHATASRPQKAESRSVPVAKSAPELKPCGQLMMLRELIYRQNRSEIGKGKMAYRYDHQRPRFMFKWNPGTYVKRKVLSLIPEFGRIIAVANDAGMGTPLYPAVLIEFWDGSQDWAMPAGLTKITEKQYLAEVARDPRRLRPAPNFELEPPPPPYDERGTVVGFGEVGADSLGVAIALSGREFVVVGGATEDEVDRSLKNLPLGIPNARAIVVLIAPGKTLRYAMNALAKCMYDGVDIERVLIWSAPQSLAGIGLEQRDAGLASQPPPHLLRCTEQEWRSAHRGSRWFRFNDPDAPIVTDMLGDDSPAEAFDAQILLATNEPREAVTACMPGNWESVSSVVSKMHAVRVVGSFSDAEVEMAPDAVEDKLETENTTLSKTPASISKDEEMPEERPGLVGYESYESDAREEAGRYNLPLDEFPKRFLPARRQRSFDIGEIWKSRPELLPGGVGTDGFVNRNDLFALAGWCRSGDASWIDLLKGVFVWGYAGVNWLIAIESVGLV